MGLLACILALIFPWYYITRQREGEERTTVRLQAWYQAVSSQQCEDFNSWSSQAQWQVRVVFCLSWALSLLSFAGAWPQLAKPASKSISAFLASVSFLAIFSFVIGSPVAFRYAQTECVYGPCDSFNGTAGNAAWGPVFGFWAACAASALFLAAGVFCAVSAIVHRSEAARSAAFTEEEIGELSLNVGDGVYYSTLAHERAW